MCQLQAPSSSSTLPQRWLTFFLLVSLVYCKRSTLAQSDESHSSIVCSTRPTRDLCHNDQICRQTPPVQLCIYCNEAEQCSPIENKGSQNCSTWTFECINGLSTEYTCDIAERDCVSWCLRSNSKWFTCSQFTEGSMKCECQLVNALINPISSVVISVMMLLIVALLFGVNDATIPKKPFLHQKISEGLRMISSTNISKNNNEDHGGNSPVPNESEN